MNGQRKRWIAIYLVAAIVLVAHAGYLAKLQGSHCIDDAYISFRYASNLVSGDGLTFNPGERVEGYTNFAWIVLMTPFEAFSVNPAIAARLLNGLLGLGLLLLAMRFMQRRTDANMTSVLLAGVLLASDGSMARWTQDGMETVLFALLTLSGVVLDSTPRRRPWSAILFGAATLTRPEGLLFFGILLARRALARREPLRSLAPDAITYSAFVVPWVAWKWFYYGSPLPNTFHAKVGYTTDQMLRGLDYLEAFALHHRLPLLAVVALAWLLVQSRRAKKRGQPPGPVVPLSLGLAWLVYVVAVGGDWMGPGRFMVPALALLYLPLAQIVGQALQPFRSVFAGLFILGLGGVQFYLTSVVAEQPLIERERLHLDSRDAVGVWLRENAAPGDTILSTEIGQLAYVSGLYTDDVHGLTDERIARLKVEGMGRGKAGHEKYDLVYSYSKRPTWVCIPGIARSYQQSAASFPPFADYRPVAPRADIPLPEYRVLLRLRGP